MRISSELQFPLMLLPSFCLRRPSDVQKVGSFDYANPSACQTCRPGKTCRTSDRQLQKISSKPKPHWSSLQRGLSGNECVHLCSVPAWLLPSGWRNGMRAEPWLPQPSRELEGQRRRRLRASRVAERRCTQLATDVFQALAMSIGSLGRCAYVCCECDRYCVSPYPSLQHPCPRPLKAWNPYIFAVVALCCFFCRLWGNPGSQ